MSFVSPRWRLVALVVLSLSLAMPSASAATGSCVTLTAMTYSNQSGVAWQSGNAVGVIVSSDAVGSGVTLGVTVDKGACEVVTDVGATAMNARQASMDARDQLPVLP